MATKTNTKIDTTIDFVEWNGRSVSTETYESYINNLVSKNSYGINTTSNTKAYNAISNNISGIFGMPYQFSKEVDICMETSKIGRKFNEKIFSIMPVLFLTPGVPKFMDGYGKKAKQNAVTKLANKLGNDNDDDDGAEFDDGRYYSFSSDFTLYKKYANVALRALALFMGIENVSVPVPGKSTNVKLGNIDVKDFMNNDFTKIFGSQATVPFYIDAENAVSESFDNSTTESALSQTVNGYSQNAKEIQFLMGGKDSKGLLKSVGSALTDIGSNVASSFGELSEIVAGNNLFSRLSNELTTVVSGGKIIFPEIWSDSEYTRNFDINMKFRSPDPDPVSIYLNCYMPVILLISMAAPHQIANRSNSYESPFLVRATYRSIFNCDLGIISSLSINKGGEGNWNVMGHPLSIDVTLNIKDLYGSMFISKRMGLITNTAQMDYLATMAGIDMNEYEPTRMIKLYNQILGDTPRDWANDAWGGIKKNLNKNAAKVLSKFSDTRFLGY